MNKKWLLVILCCVGLFVGGCWEEALAGFGIGVAVGETTASWEENLEAKGVELAAEYEKQIQAIRDANTPAELKFAEEKAQVLQIALAANDTAKRVMQAWKKDKTPKTTMDWLDLLIPLGLGLYGRERLKNFTLGKKRQAEKAGRELALRELHEMPDEDITSAKVEKIMYKDIGAALA